MDPSAETDDELIENTGLAGGFRAQIGYSFRPPEAERDTSLVRQGLRSGSTVTCQLGSSVVAAVYNIWAPRSDSFDWTLSRISGGRIQRRTHNHVLVTAEEPCTGSGRRLGARVTFDLQTRNGVKLDGVGFVQYQALLPKFYKAKNNAGVYWSRNGRSACLFRSPSHAATATKSSWSSVESKIVEVERLPRSVGRNPCP